jgi:hypothetical protein
MLCPLILSDVDCHMYIYLFNSRDCMLTTAGCYSFLAKEASCAFTQCKGAHAMLQSSYKPLSPSMSQRPNNTLQ